MPTINHIHVYIRANKRQYKCADPDCTHVINKELIKNKRSICAVCKKNELTLTSEDLKRSFPRCANCSNTKENRAARERLETLKELGL